MAVYHESTDDATCEKITLLNSLSGERLKLPYVIMRDCGPTTQTLGGLLRITNRETFVSHREIAKQARVPQATVRKHLVALHDRGWIINGGRQRTRAGRLRRSVTVKIPKRTRDAVQQGYGLLPWWGSCWVRNLHGRRKGGRLPWSTKALLAIVMGRLCTLKAAAEADGEAVVELGDIEGVIGGELHERFRFSLQWIQDTTGLSRDSIVAAKRFLKSQGIVKWYRGEDCHQPDILLPDWDFRVTDTPAPQGGCYLDFDRGSKSGR